MTLTDRDLAELAAAGIAQGEAERQLRLLRSPPRFVVLDRPCRVGDGIEQIADEAEWVEAHAAAAERGRVSLFIPASGAATRMFKDLLARDAGAVKTFVEGLPRFAFTPELAAQPVDDPAAAVADRYAQLPKGLIPFHRVGDETRTPLEEHLVEAAALARDDAGCCRLHFTVSPEHLDRFRALLERARARLEPRLGVTYEVGFSTQRPSTDTLATDGAGDVFRASDGGLLLRPAGHGALLENLRDAGGDLVLVKNIDNVAAEPWKEPSLRVGRLLLGRLAELQEDCAALLARLDDEGDDSAPGAAARFAAEELSRAVPTERGALREALDRPLRVCGMVPNTGEPGGGPFWVRGADGALSRQIVESAEVDPGAPEQRALLSSSTHFNPVLLACALRDRHGRPYALERWVDPAAVIITRKSSGGRDLVALERPGLWNGAMAGWNTVFVEVPLGAFNPVKTVNDLLRREHQP